MTTLPCSQIFHPEFVRNFNELASTSIEAAKQFGGHVYTAGQTIGGLIDTHAKANFPEFWKSANSTTAYYYEFASKNASHYSEEASKTYEQSFRPWAYQHGKEAFKKAEAFAEGLDCYMTQVVGEDPVAKGIAYIALAGVSLYVGKKVKNAIFGSDTQTQKIEIKVVSSDKNDEAV